MLLCSIYSHVYDLADNVVMQRDVITMSAFISAATIEFSAYKYALFILFIFDKLINIQEDNSRRRQSMMFVRELN